MEFEDIAGGSELDGFDKLSYVLNGNDILTSAFLNTDYLITMFSNGANDFDGIDLNGRVVDISKQLAHKGYIFDPETGCLSSTGEVSPVYITLEYDKVSQAGKLGRLIVDMTMSDPSAAQVVATTFAVLYRALPSQSDEKKYQVSDDGTTASVQPTDGGVRIIYTTPYYDIAQ